MKQRLVVFHESQNSDLKKALNNDILIISRTADFLLPFKPQQTPDLKAGITNAIKY